MASFKSQVEELLINFGNDCNPKPEDVQLAGMLLASVMENEIQDTALQTAVRLGQQPDKMLGYLKGVVAKQGASSARGGQGQGSGSGTAGPAGSQPITITIYDPNETPDTTTATFKDAQKFEKFLDRGNITFLYKDGSNPGINDYSDLVPGATYTTAVRSIPARVKSLEQHKEHLVRRRENEFTCAILDDLASQGIQAVELEEERVVKAGGADASEVDTVLGWTVSGCVGAVSFEGGPGRKGAACCVRRGFVVGSAKTHVSGDSDVRNLSKKIQQQYAQREPYAGNHIQPAFMPELVKSGQRSRLEDTCRPKGVWLYARNGRSISRVKMQAAASARLALF